MLHAQDASSTNSKPPAVVGSSAATNQAQNAVAAVAAPPALALTNPVPQAAVSPVSTNSPAVGANPSAQNIRFQFDGLPYSEVIERFAQMAKKPLLSDTNIQGSLSYNDPKPYTYQEAFDTLNIILSMKGLMLVETEHYLQLVPFRQLPQMPLRILKGLDQTGDVRPGEVLTVLLDLKNLDAREISESITPMLSNAGSIASLSRGKGLIITDRLSNIQRIRSLLNQIDTEAVVERQMRTYSLLHSSGSVVTDLINRTFGIATAPKRTEFNQNSKRLEVLPPDPNDYITAVYDDASRTLVLFGPRDRIVLAEELIKKFEDQSGNAAGEIRIYFPQSLRAEQLAQMIRQAIPGIADRGEEGRGSRGEDRGSASVKARLIVDTQTNRLIVAAPAASQLDAIENFINRVDKPVHGADGAAGVTSQTIQITQVIRPRTADPDSIAKIVTAAMTKRSFTGAMLPTINVTVDSGSQSVVVTGSPGEVQQALDIVKQLESGSALPSSQQTRFIEMASSTEMERLTPLIEQLYRNQVSGGLSNQVAHAKIISDPTTPRLIITASEEHLKIIDQIITQLRTDKSQSPDRRLHPVALKNTRVDAIMRAVSDLVDERMMEKSFKNTPKPLLVSDAANNRIMVTATEQQFKEIEQIVNTLDVPSEKSRREMKIIPLQAKTAAELIPMVTQLLGQVSDSANNPLTAPKLVPDATGRQIIALALPGDLQRINDLVQQLDAAITPAANVQFKAVELNSRNAAELTPMVQQLYQAQLRGRPEPVGGPATLVSEAKNNRIMVSGATAEIERVEAIIRQLDPLDKKGAKDETRVFRLKSAIAADLAGLVEKTFSAQSMQVKVLVDPRSNSLIITGDSKAVEAASQVINQLDTKSDVAPRELRIMELKSTEAGAIMGILQGMFTEMVRERRSPDYISPTRIIPDSASNRLIVTGPQEELELLNSLVEQLDSAPEGAGGARVFKLNMADAYALAPVVSNAMLRFDARNQPIRKVMIAPDTKSNSLIVSGSRSELQDAASIIEKLDEEAKGSGRILKVMDINTDDPDQLVSLSMKIMAVQVPNRALLNEITIAPQPSGRRLIVLAPENMLPQVEKIITSLDDQSNREGRELKLIDLKNSSAPELLPVVTRVYMEQAKGKTIKPAFIVADGTGTRLAVWGTPEQAESVEKLVATLESKNPAITRETKTYDFRKNSEASRVLPLVQQLYRDRMKSSNLAGPADAQFMTDNRTGRILVSARKEQFEEIEKVFAQFQPGVAAGTPRETRTIEVGSPAEASRLLSYVQQLYRDAWTEKGEDDPPDAQIIADPRTGRYLIMGRAHHLTKIEEIVSQLKKSQPKLGSIETRVYDLNNALATELSDTVRTLYMEQIKTRVEPPASEALILPDPAANRLIISGMTNEIAAIEEIIKKLDKVSAQSAGTRVFKLKMAEATAVAPILSTAMVQVNTYGRRIPRVSVGADYKSNTLIVSGEPRDLQSAALIIEELDKLGQMPERNMKVLPLKSGRATEIVSKVKQLYEDQSKGVTEPGATPALIMEDASSDQLIVAGSEKQLELIEKIVGQLQENQVKQKPRESRMYEVGQADEATRLRTLIQQLYQDQWKNKGASDPADAQIIIDDKTGRMIVTGRPDHLSEIESLLAKVGSPSTNAPARETRVYDLNSSTASEIAATVKTLYQDYLKTHPSSTANQALILPDASANRLVVTGATNEVTAIESIVKQLDTVNAQSGGARVFKLKTASVAQVSAILSTALVQNTPWGRPTPRVSVGSDLESNLLVISGNPKDVQAAATIIEEMDKSASQESRQMRIIPIKNGVASEMATRVRDLYKDQVKGQASPNKSDALIMGDDSSNRLIITGIESQLQMIESIVRQLQEGGQGTPRQIRVMLLRYNSAMSLSAMISQLFSRQIRSDEPGQRLVVTAGYDDRTLVIDAAGQTLEQITELVKALDNDEARGSIQVRTYHLPEGNAADLAPTLGRLFVERRGRGGYSGMEPKFEADPASNVLMVAANKDQFVQIEKLIDELKKTAEITSEIRTFRLKYGDASQMSMMLEDLLSETTGGRTSGRGGMQRRSWGGGGGGPYSSGRMDPKAVRVMPAPSLNAVVVQGPPERLVFAEKLIEMLDKVEMEGQSVIQTVHLKKSQSETVAEAVNRAMGAKSASGRLQRASVTAVMGSNSLLVNGPSEVVEEIMKIVKELDQESTGDDIEVRIYKLENGVAKEVSSILNQLLQSVTRNQFRTRFPSRMGTATITIDERSNSLIIAATETHFKLVEQILPTLDKAPDRSDKDVQFVWLQNARSEDVAITLSAVFAGRPASDQPIIEPDFMSNSITVIGRPADIAQIQDLIAQLDETTHDTSIQVRFRSLDRIPVEQMSKMLQNIYPQMSTGRIRMVDKINPPPKPVKATTSRTSTGSSTNQPVQVQTSVTNVVDNAAETPQEPVEVAIAVDRTSNALIMSGPAYELDQVDRIITDLSYGFVNSDAEFRQFPLKEADPVMVARTLTDLFKPEVKVDPQQQQQRGQEQKAVVAPPKITVVAEPRTRSIIVRAKPTDFILLESLIQQLDGAGLSSQLEYKLVILENSQPDKVLPLVQQMVSQLNLSKPGDPLTISADMRNRAILVVARNVIITQLERMIKALDTPSEFAEAEVLVLTLKKASAPQIATLLQNILRPAIRGETTAEARELQEQIRRLKVLNELGKTVILDLTKPVKIVADPAPGSQRGGNRLIITSTHDNLKGLAAVVEMMDTVPVTDGVNVKLISLKHADVDAVVDTLSTIFQEGRRLAQGPAGIAQPEGLTGKALVSPLNVAGDQRSNTLILSGQVESLDLAVKIVEDLDKQLDRFVTEVKLFRLKHASAIRLAPLLQAVFAEGPSVRGAEGLNTQVTRLRAVLEKEDGKTTEQPKSRPALLVRADDPSNVMIVAARSDAMPLIEEIIKQLDVPSASGLDVVRIYPLNHLDASSFQQTIDNLYQGPRANLIRPEDHPNITIDPRTNALIVSGNEKSFAIIESLIARLDNELPQDMRDIHILPMENADADTVASSVQRIMDARLRQKPGLGKSQLDAMRVVVLGDPRSNSLLIAASKESYDLVESLAKELDKAPTAISGRIRLIPLTHADSRALGTSLLALFNQRYQAARSPDLMRNRPIILPDARSNSLLVAATADDNLAIDDLLKRLDKKVEDPSMVLTVIPLKHNDASGVTANLESIFAAKIRNLTMGGQPPSPRDQVNVEADSLNNSIIVLASKENLETINGLLEKIDIEPVAVDGLVQTFTLQHADAQRVTSMLRALISQGIYRPGMGAAGRGAKRETIAITADPRSNSLIVSASPENLLVVKQLIKQVDSKEYMDSSNIRIFPLKHARSSSLANVLEQFFRARRTSESFGAGSGERSVPVTVTPDDRTNTLLITGGKESFDVIERIIQQLDTEDSMAKLNFRVFPLKNATAAKLQGTLQQLFQRRPSAGRGETPEPVTIIADAWVNALIVGATVDDLAMVASLIETLDTRPATPGVEATIIPLVKASARSVAQTIQGLYRSGAPGGAQMQIGINIDERLNAIVVSAGEADSKRIAELVKKLDTDQVARVTEIRVIQLRFARAEILSTMLNTALNTRPPELTDQSPNTQSLLQFITQTEDGKQLITSALKEAVLITPDIRMNSLIVSAPVDYMGLLEQIVTRLDTTSPQQAKIKVFTMKNAVASQMATIITEVFRMRAVPGATAATQQRSIEYTLVKPPMDDAIYEEENEESASATLGSAEQTSLTVTVDRRTNSLIVGGSDEYVDLVSEIITTLDSRPAQERRSQVMRMKNAQALQIQTAVRSFLDMERLRITQVLGVDAVGAAQNMLDREVAIVAETNSNALLLSASPQYFDEIKELIDQLDQPQPQVLIQVLLAEVSLDRANDLGLDWSYNFAEGAAKVAMSSGLGVASDLKTYGGFSSSVTGSDYNFLLRALENDGKLEVLSRPQILTGDNQAASINIGQRIPMITDSRVTDQGNTLNSYRYEAVGVNMTVTPRIGVDGTVRMEISTTNSSLSSSSINVSSGLTMPIINERRAQTTVTVQSGQTIIIGGLISTSDDNRVKRLPWLGRIPGIGLLFSSSKKSVERKELLILLTPQVLIDTEKLAKISNVRSITREQLDRSVIQSGMKKDSFRKQLLDPLYPDNGTNQPVIIDKNNGKTKTGKS